MQKAVDRERRREPLKALAAESQTSNVISSRRNVFDFGKITYTSVKRFVWRSFPDRASKRRRKKKMGDRRRSKDFGLVSNPFV